MKINISIILPIYNVEDYLPQCLDSILSQTEKNIEVICVNDGSPDNCAQILEEYSLRDSRIKIITQENSGVSTARNRGLDQAQGDYIHFCDSDDYFAHNRCLEEILTLITQNDLDILSFNFKNVGLLTHDNKSRVKPDQVISGISYLNNGRFSVMPWARLMKREYIKSLSFHFKENLQFEDDEASPRLFAKAKRVMHTNKIIYAYRSHPNSNIKETYQEKHYIGAKTIVNTYIIEAASTTDATYIKYCTRQKLYYFSLLYKIMRSLNEEQFVKDYQTSKHNFNFSKFELFAINAAEKYARNFEQGKTSFVSSPLIYLERKFFKLYYKVSL